MPEYLVSYDPFEDTVKSLNTMNNNYIDRLYDKDLISYYYRADGMTISEFKYIAFYQILECIFDEVYLSATIQDIKQITNSSWYSSNENKDIVQLIEVIEKYLKTKNDREKLRLVLEKYFKGSLHKDAYFLANKEIYNILKDEMELINNKEKFNDMQTLANILYNYRCECTHSNRLFTVKYKVDKDESSIYNYILLIKKITQRIIVNYNLNMD